MKLLIYFILVIFLFSCDSEYEKCLKDAPPMFPDPGCGHLLDNQDTPDIPPDKPLKEIRFFGSHAVGWHGYPSGDFVFQGKFYCYKEEEEKNKGFPYIKKKGAIYDNDNPYIENELVAHDTLLQARLYTKEDKFLAETNLRCDTAYSSPDKCLGDWGPFLDIYLPYFKEAYKIKIVKIEEGKEVILDLVDNRDHPAHTKKERRILSYEEIRKIGYAEENECHNISLSYEH